MKSFSDNAGPSVVGLLLLCALFVLLSAGLKAYHVLPVQPDEQGTAVEYPDEPRP